MFCLGGDGLKSGGVFYEFIRLADDAGVSYPMFMRFADDAGLSYPTFLMYMNKT